MYTTHTHNTCTHHTHITHTTHTTPSQSINRAESPQSHQGPLTPSVNAYAQRPLRQHSWALPAPPLPPLHSTHLHISRYSPSPALQSFNHSANLQGTRVIILEDHRKGRKAHGQMCLVQQQHLGKQGPWDSRIINTTPLCWYSPNRTKNELICWSIDIPVCP